MPFFKQILRTFRILQTSHPIATAYPRRNQLFRLFAIKLCAACGGIFTAWYTLKNVNVEWKNFRAVNAKVQIEEKTEENESSNRKEKESKEDILQHTRALRFTKFASVEYNDDLYMTPQDFLESVTEEDPRPRLNVRKLSDDDLQEMFKITPGVDRSSPNLLRSIHDKGIISYTEYLFLLCILTKPHIGFKIAFNMFDTDGNNRVEKNEFMVLEEIFRKKSERSRKNKQKTNGFSTCSSCLGTIVQASENVQDTTLLVHFFGADGNGAINYDQFHVFMHNLQTEVFELEFMMYSHGMPTISEEDFARVLLRYTDVLDENEHIEKLRKRMPEEKGITFEEFKSFFQFLNNLEDFAISMQMYSFAGRPFGEDEFRRAVKVSTGHDLSPHLIKTLFELFDNDNDGKLSYVEFIGVMKDRIHRGFRFQRTSHLIKHAGWNGFKKCLKHEIKESNKQKGKA